MKVEAQLYVLADPVPHEIGPLDEFVDNRRWLVTPPFAARTRFEGLVSTPLLEKVEPLPRRRLAFIAQTADSPVRVHAYPVAHRATQQLVHGHTEVLAGYVPQRLVDAGQRRHQHVAAAKKRRAIDVLPVVLDAQRILADEILRQLLDSRCGTPRLPLQRRLPPADDPTVGGHLHQPHPRPGKKLIDPRNLHSCLLSCTRFLDLQPGLCRDKWELSSMGQPQNTALNPSMGTKNNALSATWFPRSSTW